PPSAGRGALEPSAAGAGAALSAAGVGAEACAAGLAGFSAAGLAGASLWGRSADLAAGFGASALFAVAFSAAGLPWVAAPPPEPEPEPDRVWPPLASTRDATSSSTDDEDAFTSTPASLRRARTSLAGRPRSFAIS